MIILSLSLVYDQFLLPHHRRKLDRIDHVLVWTIKICLVILFFTLPDLYNVVVIAQEHSIPPQEFFFACSGGDVEKVKNALADHPDWVHARTENGETPLHLTGIYGHDQITKLLLEHGADPNARSTFEKGLRMHPLSWNVYGGHLENIRLLLEHGADVNLDFDSMVGAVPVTALDVLLQLQHAEKGDERFLQMETLLEKFGAKTMEEVKPEEKEGDEL
ncbi:ankyrin repeat domain protein [Nitzschia inconspicua]|uniref:Ankyrin repeat domain protein n=1 Tax=Nitzschia inconspicua TaxID=303405 RepID=A0A9K3M4J4_9STRA|nr:ankyrin repeat domain protein [Nitzschia inconspicua]